MSNVNDYNVKLTPNLQNMNTAAAAAGSGSGYLTANADGSVGTVGGLFAGLRVRLLGSSESQHAREIFLRVLTQQYPAPVLQALYKATGVNDPSKGALSIPEFTNVVQKAEALWAKSGYCDPVIEGHLGQVLTAAVVTTTAAEFAEYAPVVLGLYISSCVERCQSGKATAAQVDATFNHLLGTLTEPQLERVRAFLNDLVTDKAGPKAMLGQLNHLIEARLALAPRVRGEAVEQAPMGTAAVASRGRTEAVVVATAAAAASTAAGVVFTAGSAAAAAYPATPVVNTVVPQQNNASAAAAATGGTVTPSGGAGGGAGGTVTPSGGAGGGAGGAPPQHKTDS